jgi:hypothetical protein
MRLQSILSLDLGSPIGQCRAAPLSLGGRRTVLVAYCADFDDDPYTEMFFFPTDTLKVAVFAMDGEVVWQRDLGPAVVPGVWFCPVFPFDLDGDGTDEVWLVNNTDPDHPLATSSYVLERWDGRTGETLGQWPWPCFDRAQPLSHLFRNFILGGHVRGEPVLLTAQGTYADMHLQAWGRGVKPRWTRDIPADAPGARGSHMCPLVDFDGDGVDAVLWGERAIDLDTGAELFCADRDVYQGHSDVVQPVWDRDRERWLIYTTREGDPGAAPRVVCYDAQGERVWGAVDRGHMDMGWVAHWGEGEILAMAIRIGKKTCGPDGRFHFDRDSFVFDARTGEPVELPLDVYRTLPVDLNGDGYHELVRGVPGGDGVVLDRQGRELGRVPGTVAMLSKICDHPGEQVLVYRPDGVIEVWADADAQDTDRALARYTHPFYWTNRRLTACGYNLVNLGGV